PATVPVTIDGGGQNDTLLLDYANGNPIPPGGLTTTNFAVVKAINQAPTLTVPGAQIAYEDVDKNLTGLSVGDPDSERLTVMLHVDHGTLKLGTTTGLTTTGTGTGSVSLFGTVADLNAALATLVYRGVLNYSGSDTLSITASDGSFNTSGSVSVTVKSA